MSLRRSPSPRRSSSKGSGGKHIRARRPDAHQPICIGWSKVQVPVLEPLVPLDQTPLPRHGGVPGGTGGGIPTRPADSRVSKLYKIHRFCVRSQPFARCIALGSVEILRSGRNRPLHPPPPQPLQRDPGGWRSIRRFRVWTCAHGTTALALASYYSSH